MLPEHDGLHEEWKYPTIYMNPPYGADRERGTTIKHWLAKCASTYRKYDSEILALVPVATNTSHWKHSVFGVARAICFLYDTRLKFLENGNGGGKGAPMACAMIYWGRNYNKFYDVFIDYGAVVDISSLINEEIGATRKQPKLFSVSLEEHQENIGELYDADPNCWHELDENCLNGERCKICGGWFCF